MKFLASNDTDLVVLNSKGVPVTTSLKLARGLGKQHRIIASIIEGMDLNEWEKNNFYVKPVSVAQNLIKTL